jgi:integrase
MAKTNRINFTAGRVASFKCPPSKKEAYLWDAAAPGLGIRARTGGSRNFIHQGRVPGCSPIRTTIGSVEAWDLDTAREEARRLQRLLDTGTTPKDEKQANEISRKRKAAQEAIEKITLADVWPIYIEAKQHKWSKHSLKDHHKAVQEPNLPKKRSKDLTKAGALYSLLPIKLSELDEITLSNWLKNESKNRPTVAARAYRLLSACLRWCSELSKPAYGLPALNSVVQVPALKHSSVKDYLAKSEAKDDCLQKEQLSAWFQYARTAHNPIIGAYLQTLLLTGARREELAQLTWHDIDFQWQSITIRDKVEGTRTIPLTPYVHLLLANLPKRNESVFSSPTSKSGHITNPRATMVNICELAGIPNVTLHGLRRSFKSLSEWVEVPVGIVAQIQGHKPSATVEKHYTNRPLDLLRKWHTTLEAWILEQAGLDQPELSHLTLRAVQ